MTVLHWEQWELLDALCLVRRRDRIDLGISDGVLKSKGFLHGMNKRCRVSRAFLFESFIVSPGTLQFWEITIMFLSVIAQ